MLNRLYFTIKPLLPRWLQLTLRRQRAALLLRAAADRWPIWEEAGAPPPRWPGWPGGKRFALVLTHDVESADGVRACRALAALEEARGLRSAFAFVPKRYPTPPELCAELRARGFEIMLHGLYHDGKEFSSWPKFSQRAEAINRHLAQWRVGGFSAPSTQHNLAWIGALDVTHSVSTYDSDPQEPQPCGFGRIFPFWVAPPDRSLPGYVELPYTLAQDFTLFVLLGQRDIGCWRRKLDWIAARGGMALLKTHPDYMRFSDRERARRRYPAASYTDLLDYALDRYADQAWIAQPAEVARFWASLQPELAPGENLLPARPTLCRSCRQLHERGWLHHYPPVVRRLALNEASHVDAADAS